MVSRGLRHARKALALLVCGWALAAAGCASTPSDESAMPWNTPQPWEGSPTIPGLSDR